MESLVALGFAANVVQFADFATRVISQSIKIYRARTHFTDAHTVATDLGELELQLITYTKFIEFDDEVRQNLGEKPLHRKLQENGLSAKKPAPVQRIVYDPTIMDEDLESMDVLDANRLKQLSGSDREIFRVCLKCEDLALSLRQAIAKLKGSSKPTLWNSFAEALKTIWSEEKFRGLAQQLKDYREQMIVLLLVSLREKVQESASAQSSNYKDLYQATQLMRNKMNGLLLSQEKTKIEIIQAIQKDYLQPPVSLPDHQPLDQLQRELTPETTSHFNRRLLQWVRFSEIETRHEKIAIAYEETFEWIFRPPLNGQWSDFSLWLQDEAEPLYWITGKPAAGKSTLLKFIQNDQRTKRFLEKWAGDKKLINCAFYFWNSGVSIQMSREGLLRTILYDALSQAPELWSVLFPSKMEEYILFANPFQWPITEAESEKAFQFLLQGAGTKYRLFLSLDGLDEYGEDPGPLVTMIKRFVSPDVKACVSSRDWSVFDDGFQTRPRLRLEDITHADIKQYVTSRFTESPAYRERRLEMPDEIEALMENLTTKASGVFLWVQLVTDSLLKGLESGLRIEELQERLDAVPVALEDLFWKILTDVQQEHRMHMSQLLQIMRCQSDPLSLLDFFYADDLSPDIVSKTRYGIPDPLQAEARALTMQRRLKTCCKGLLQAEQRQGLPLASASVTYLHRTVRDYLDRREIWSQFVEMTDTSFNLSFRMYNMYMIRIKMMFQANDAFDQSFWDSVLHAIDCATRADPKNRAGQQINLLIQLDEVADYAAKPKFTSTTTHWSSLGRKHRFNSSFLHLAIQLQLFEYINHALSLFTLPPTNTTIYTQQDYTMMLLLATLYYDIFAKDKSLPQLDMIPSSPSEKLVATFLALGADPNHSIPDALRDYGNITGSYSTWQVHKREPDHGTDAWNAIDRLFVKYEAKRVEEEKKKKKEKRKEKFSNFGSMFRVGHFRVKHEAGPVGAISTAP